MIFHSYVKLQEGNPIFGSPSAPGFHPPSRHGGGAHRGLLRRRELRLAVPRAADRGAAEADARVVRAPGPCHVGGDLSLWPPGFKSREALPEKRG